MKGKGLTPAQLQINWFNPATGTIIKNGPYTSLPSCIAAINDNSAYTPAVSYYKAFRGLKQYGVYTTQLASIEADQDGTRAILVLIISADTGHEVVPTIARVQYELEPGPAPLFEPTTLPELGALAASINKGKKVAPAQEKAAKKLAVMEGGVDVAMQAAVMRAKAARVQQKPVKQAKAAKPVVKLSKFRMEYYRFTPEGHRYELTSIAVVRAATKKTAKDVLREMCAGAKLQIMWVEPAANNARVDTKFV